jgi:hypothetical protein
VDRDDLVVLDPHGRARLGEEGGDRRRNEVLMLAEPDDQRTLLPGPHQGVGLIAVHRDERIVPSELAERRSDGIGQIPFIVTLDEMADDLGVGLGGELVTVRPQVTPQLRVVFDDPVEDDVDLVLAVAVRMGVLLGDPAVGGPARVPEADRRRRGGDRDRAAAVRGMLLDSGPQVRQVADGAHAVDPAVRDHRNAGRVIASVLELLQPCDQQISARSVTHISDDAAHKGATG